MAATLHIIKSLIYGAILGAVVFFGLKYLQMIERTNTRNRAVEDYNNERYRSAVRTFQAAWDGDAAGPSPADQGTYFKAAHEAGIKAYEDAILGGIGADDAIWLLEEADKYGDLEEKAQGYLCDAYIRTGNFDKARAYMDACKSSGQTFARMKTLEKKLVETQAYFKSGG